MLHLLFYSLPVQLLFFHLKRNLSLLAVWVALALVVMGLWGKTIGLPYLFLAPEYRGQVGFVSMFLTGIALGSFIMSFHLTSFVLGINRFTFLGLLRYPLLRFCFNNSFIPLVFIGLYVIEFTRYQLNFEMATAASIVGKISGLLLGSGAMIVLSMVYFHYTSLDRFQRVMDRVDRRIRQNNLSRIIRSQKLKNIQTGRYPIKSYLDFPFRLRRIQYSQPIGQSDLLQIFDQNQFNAIALQVVFFGLLTALGWFPENEWLQIPAAATSLLLFAFIMMLIGAVNFWFRGWALTLAALLVGGVGWFRTDDGHSSRHQAFGLNYQSPPAEYSIPRLRSLGTTQHYAQDTTATLQILVNWRQKFPTKPKPKLVFICTSGGGQRAAVWTVRCLQAADSATAGSLMHHAQLITGASGGMIGAAYFREVWLRAERGQISDPYSDRFIDKIAKDRLNPLVFALVANDLAFPWRTFSLNGQEYHRDRGYAFEQKLNIDTEFLLDKTVADYREPEQAAQIPMLLLAATIINDGRRLYISPQPVSYLTGTSTGPPDFRQGKITGIELGRFFQQHSADSLRFLTALRMNATFPYVTPNVILPSDPPMEVMDAGLSDNFGVLDAVQFLFVFRDWIAKNTSGVVLVRIRDSPQEINIRPAINRSLLFKLFSPIEHLVDNLDHLQDARNEAMVNYAHKWFANSIHTVDFQYSPSFLMMDTTRHAPAIHQAPLSWRLTVRERDGIKEMMQTANNQRALKNLQTLLQ